MIDKAQASEIAMRRLSDMELDAGASLVFTEVREFAFGWVFFYNSKAYVESGDISDALAGNAPFLIDSSAGSLHVFGTANPVEFYLKDFQ
jgi:hypothetical protein